MTNNKKTSDNNKPSQSTNLNTRPSFKIQYKTLDFSTLKNEEEKKKTEFENERKVICYETGLDLKDIQRIEREYCLTGMEGLVKMGNEYFIPDWYEYKLHEYVYRNKKIIQKENKK